MHILYIFIRKRDKKAEEEGERIFVYLRSVFVELKFKIVSLKILFILK